jgi:membrane fusion protein (multidrug efflux system)
MKRILVAILAVALAAGAWFLLKPRTPVAAENDKPVAQVRLAALLVMPIVDSLPAFGVVEPAPSGARSVTLAYDVVVVNVLVSPGATVAAGDVIMRTEATPDATLAVNSARSQASLAERALAAARQRYELKLATSQDLLAAEQASEDAKLRLASLVGRGQSGDGRLLAPVSGIVTKLDPQPGAVVPAGTPLVVIAGGGRMEVHLALEAADAGRVVLGDTVDLTMSDRPGHAVSKGTVRMVGAAVDPATGAVDVRVSMPSGGAWFVGEHVRGGIQVQVKMALVAPRAAVLPDGEQQVLYTVKDNRATRHSVRVGIASGDNVEVVGGDLHAGDMAVVVGNYELEDGMAVQVSPGDAKGDAGPTPEKAP